MAAVMVVLMDIIDEGWTGPYFAAVPDLLAEYGGRSIAGGRQIRRLEGALKTPERLAVLTFPSLGAIDRFMADDRYAPFRAMRETGAISQIFVFENAVQEGALV